MNNVRLRHILAVKDFTEFEVEIAPSGQSLNDLNEFERAVVALNPD